MNRKERRAVEASKATTERIQKAVAKILLKQLKDRGIVSQHLVTLTHNKAIALGLLAVDSTDPWGNPICWIEQEGNRVTDIIQAKVREGNKVELNIIKA